MLCLSKIGSCLRIATPRVRSLIFNAYKLRLGMGFEKFELTVRCSCI